MNGFNSTVRNLLTKNIDIDVYDDYDESIGIAFCGPVELTTEGEKEFSDVLDTAITYMPSPYDYIVVHVNDDEKKLNKLNKLFNALAGFCSVENYEKWIKED